MSTLSTVAGERQETSDRRPRLNQPYRAFVAIGELLLATAAVIVAVLCWHRGIATMITPLGNGRPPLVSTMFHGSWQSGAIGLVLVAGLLLLDALRQVLLATRTRQRPATPPPGVPLADDPDDDPADHADETDESSKTGESGETGETGAASAEPTAEPSHD